MIQSLCCCVLLDMGISFSLHDEGRPTVHPRCTSTCAILWRSLGISPSEAA